MLALFELISQILYEAFDIFQLVSDLFDRPGFRWRVEVSMISLAAITLDDFLLKVSSPSWLCLSWWQDTRIWYASSSTVRARYAFVTSYLPVSTYDTTSRLRESRAFLDNTSYIHSVTCTTRLRRWSRDVQTLRRLPAIKDRHAFALLLGQTSWKSQPEHFLSHFRKG